jgi:prepilin-type N-terminal cleavage/methylation domain-containing protein/prepilin-type processing-associated H-X9-DG protein
MLPIIKRNSVRGFTLVELLVVMAIILILIGLSYPATLTALTHARTAKCSNNVRQIAIGMLAFAGDNNGNLPISGSVIPYNTLSPDTGQYGWTQQLEPYMGVGSSKEDPSGKSVYQCPDRASVTGNTYYSYFNGAHAAYAQSNGSFAAVSIMKMRSPASHIIVGDISVSGIFGTDDADKDDYTQDPAFNGATTASSNSIGIHGGTVNIGFADGHVENLRYFDNTKMTTVYPGPGKDATGNPYNYLYPH